LIYRTLVGASDAGAVALEAHRAPGIHTTELADSARQIYAVTYGDPPDPPATTALIDILQKIA
jgi:hypothetical protein